MKRKLADTNADEESDEFGYQLVRRYEVKTHQAYPGADTPHPEELALVLHEGKAYYYPILTRLVIRPRRKNKFTPGMSQMQRGGDDEEEENPPAEALKLRIRDMNEAEKRRRVEYKARLEGVEAEHAGVDVDAEDEDAPGEEE